MAESMCEFTARGKSEGWILDYEKLIGCYRRAGYSAADARSRAFHMFRDSVDGGRAELLSLTEKLGDGGTVVKVDVESRRSGGYQKRSVVADFGDDEIDAETMRYLKRLIRGGRSAESNGVKATKNDIANWVFGNIPIAWKDISTKDVPSVGAVGLLFSAKKKGVRERFYVDWLKPKKADESAGSGSDDGLKEDDRSILDIIGELKTADRRAVSVLLDSAEDDGRESVVSGRVDS